MECDKKLSGYFTQAVKILKEHPVEIIIGVAAFIIYTFRDNLGVYYVFPLVFCLSYFLNRVCNKEKFRIMYYASSLLVFLLFIAKEQFSYTVGYVILIISSIVLLLVCKLYKDNRLFTLNAVRSLLAAAAAVITAGIIFLIASGIYGSVNVIFFGDKFVRDYAFYGYLAGILYTIVAPAVFFAFIRITESNEKEEIPHFINILSQYVLTPSLIIYTVVLYLYFLKIVFLWELPNGGIAIMSLVYILLGILTQAINKTKAPVSLFFKFTENFQYIAQPAVIMMWIACLYRICEYGYTEPRVYLLVTNAAVTLSLWMMMYRKTALYRNCILLTLFLFLFFTYVPGISAKTLGFNSQKKIAVTLATRFYKAGPDGEISPVIPADSSGLAADQERLRSAIWYCRGEHGYDDTNAFDNLLKEKTGISASYILEHPITEPHPGADIHRINERAVSIEGYNTLYRCWYKYNNQDSEIENFQYVTYDDNTNRIIDSLKIIYPNQTELVIPARELKEKLIPGDSLQFQLDTLDIRIIFSSIDYQKNTNEFLQITPQFVLTK